MFRLAYLTFLLFVLTIPVENMIVLSGLGTVSRAVGLLTATVTVLFVLITGRVSKLTKIHICLLLFLLWRAMSLTWSVDPESSVASVKTTVQLFLMVYILWEIVCSQKQKMAVFQAYVLGAYITVAGTIVKFVQETGVYNQRYATTGFDPNELGVIIALGIPLAWYLSLKGNSRIKNAINRFYMIPAFFTIILTASRTAFLVALLGLIIVVVSYNELDSASKIVVVAAVLGFLSIAVGVLSQSIISVLPDEHPVYTFIPKYSLERLGTINSQIKSGDMSERRFIWGGGYKIFKDHPVLGVGAGGFRRALKPILNIDRVAHNTYLSVLVEQGLIGMTLFAFILLLAVLIIRQMRGIELKLYSIILFMWIVGVSTLSWENHKVTWLLFGLIALEEKRLSSGSESLAKGQNSGHAYYKQLQPGGSREAGL